MTDDLDAVPEEVPETEWNSGPFCRHWNDPADCGEKCVECGHACPRHDRDGTSCMGEDDDGYCDCPGWENE